MTGTPSGDATVRRAAPPTTAAVTPAGATVAGRLLTLRSTPNDLTSTYVDDAFYDLIRVDIAEWPEAGRPLDAVEWQRYGGLLLQEAWLLDLRRFEEWLDLYTDDCVYWVPAVHGSAGAAEPAARSGLADPQCNVTIALDDRRRLIDRIGWVRTDLAYAQLPPSSTAHQVTGSVLVPTAVPGEVKVRSSFVVHERRTGGVRALAGWCGHVLAETDDHLRIRRKVVSLIDSGAAQHNLSFIL